MSLFCFVSSGKRFVAKRPRTKYYISPRQWVGKVSKKRARCFGGSRSFVSSLLASSFYYRRAKRPKVFESLVFLISFWFGDSTFTRFSLNLSLLYFSNILTRLYFITSIFYIKFRFRSFGSFWMEV